ncbi:MAG: hypothetical protein ACK47B_19735 [Armatimonadota bacterium]
MSDDPKGDGDGRPKNLTPEMRKALSRRGLLTGELRQASTEAIRKLPKVSPFLGAFMRESAAARDERLMENVWLLLMGRKPKPEENKAGLEVIRNAKTPDEKADALVDVLWALCQTREFEELRRPNRALIRGLYLIALDRDPTDTERDSALSILKEAVEPAARVAALEGLFTGLLRSGESVLYKR